MLNCDYCNGQINNEYDYNVFTTRIDEVVTSINLHSQCTSSYFLLKKEHNAISYMQKITSRWKMILTLFVSALVICAAIIYSVYAIYQVQHNGEENNYDCDYAVYFSTIHNAMIVDIIICMLFVLSCLAGVAYTVTN